MLKNLTKTETLVYITNPNNPTGLFMEPSLINDLINQFPHINFIIDESYIEYYNCNYSVLFNCNQEIPSNIFLLRSFSKLFGMAGLRLGYVICNNDILKKYNHKKINNIAIKVGCFMLDNYNKFILIKNNNKINRENFINKLKKSNIYAYNTNCCFTNIYLGKYVNDICNILLQNGLIVKNMESSYKIYGYIRISDAPSEIFDKIANICINSLNNINIKELIPPEEFHFSKKRQFLLSLLYEKLYPIILQLSSSGLHIMLSCGSSIGFIRNKDIIPWDDDIDLMYFGDISVFDDSNIIKLFQEHNLIIQKNRTNAYWQVFSLEINDQPFNGKLSDIHIDIFPYIKIGDKYFNNDKRFRENIDGECNQYYTSNNISHKIDYFTPFNLPVLVQYNMLEILNQSLDDNVRENVIIKRNNETYKYKIIYE
jgi:hypothetical protein